MKQILISSLLMLSIGVKSEIVLLDKVAVIVNEGVVMQSQIDAGVDGLLSQYEKQNIPKPPVEEIKSKIIEQLIIEEIQIQTAKRAGVRISDEELNETVERLAKNNNMTLEDFIKYINENGDSYENIREDIKREMMIQRVQRGLVGSEINITDNEFNTFLEKDSSVMELKPSLLIRQILVKDIDAAKKVKEELANGKSFEEAVFEYSISANKSKGGLIGLKSYGELPELFLSAMDKKDIGYISEPLESGAGFHILKLEDKQGRAVVYEEQWLSRHILLIPSTLRDAEETKIELGKLRQRIIDGEDFADIAKEYSEDPGSGSKGGDLGWQAKGVFTPEFEEVMVSSETGKISEVFESQFGYHILEVIDFQNKDITNVLIENRAYNMLYDRKFDEILENTLRSLRAEAFVEIKI